MDIIRICSYNLHSGRDTAGQPSLARIAASLAAVEPDVCLLQEVDRYLPRSRFQDQAAYLARRLDAEPHFYGRLGIGPAGFGNAVLTRRPAARIRRLALPGGGEPRAALSIALENGLAVWTTHLGLRDEWRAAQMSALAEALGAQGPLVLGGDFNVEGEDTALQQFLAQTKLQAISAASATFPVPNPMHRIDFLLAREVIAVDAATIAAPGSDHCLLWASITLPAPVPLPPPSPDAG